jgi:hypothetical protein
MPYSLHRCWILKCEKYVKLAINLLINNQEKDNNFLFVLLLAVAGDLWPGVFDPQSSAEHGRSEGCRNLVRTCLRPEQLALQKLKEERRTPLDAM